MRTYVLFCSLILVPFLTSSLAFGAGFLSKIEQAQIKQYYSQVGGKILQRGKKAKALDLLGLARYQYLRELRSTACLKTKKCPVALVDHFGKTEIVKLIVPKGDVAVVSFYGSDGWEMIGACKGSLVAKSQSCTLN